MSITSVKVKISKQTEGRQYSTPSPHTLVSHPCGHIHLKSPPWYDFISLGQRPMSRIAKLSGERYVNFKRYCSLNDTLSSPQKPNRSDLHQRLLYIYIQAPVHIYAHTHMYTLIHARAQTYIHMYTCEQTPTYRHPCISMCTYTCAHS